MMTQEVYMKRCLQLALLGSGTTAPNPMVGAVLVHEDRIIGEGYHKHYGGPHAEVNCLSSVDEADRALIPFSTLYVSLEPCNHFGKTPPCTNLIVKEKVPKVVIGCRDPFIEVNGKGIEVLKAAGVTVINNVLEKESLDTNKRFLTFHTKRRPYIILKWAESSDGFIGSGNTERLFLTNDYTNRLVHRWRSEESAILIGTNTALLDNPQLNNRYWSGPQPLRVIIDRHLRLPLAGASFASPETIIINEEKDSKEKWGTYVKVKKNSPLLPQVLEVLFERGCLSVMVEGGGTLLQSFFDTGLWDEARIITTDVPFNSKGVKAPDFWRPSPADTFSLLNDKISIYYNPAI